MQAVYCLRDYVTETATRLFCLKLAMFAKYRISNIRTIFFNIKCPSLLTKEQPVLQAAIEDSKKLSRNFSASNKCLTTATGDPIFSALKVYFMH